VTTTSFIRGPLICTIHDNVRLCMSSKPRTKQKFEKRNGKGFDSTQRRHVENGVSQHTTNENIVDILQDQEGEPGQYKVQLSPDVWKNSHTTHDAEHQAHHNVFESWITRARQDISHVATKGFAVPPSSPSSKLVSATPEWKRLERHAAETIKQTHLRDLLQDQERCDAMYAEYDGVYFDYSRQQVTAETMELLKDLSKKQRLMERVEEMMTGEKINFTEDRAVLHTALRADKSEIGSIIVDGEDAVAEVHEVLEQIKEFTEKIRSGKIRGYTGKRLRNVVSVGIGGSYLGPEFLHECLKTDPEGINSSLGYTLRFLANIDPVDVERACADLDPEETLILVVSKTFTTAETMLNARTMRQWLWDFMGDDVEVVKKHFVACASISSKKLVEDFGIDTENYFFRFWDWVGGRYSVCSAVGAVPIALQYGFDIYEKFLMVSYKSKCRLMVLDLDAHVLRLL